MTDAWIQLFLFRWRTFWRQPQAVVWPFVLQVVFGVLVLLARRAADAPAVLVLSGAFGGMWGVGWPILLMRIRGLLRRFAITAMPRTAFFAVFIFHRMTIATLEAALVTAVVHATSPETLHGRPFAVVVVAAAGGLAHGSLAVLVTSRARNMEAALALMNLVLWPSALASGVLMRAPPAIEALGAWTPIGAHLALFRAAVEHGAFDARSAAILAAWALATLAAATRLFRWA